MKKSASSTNKKTGIFRIVGLAVIFLMTAVFINAQTIGNAQAESKSSNFGLANLFSGTTNASAMDLSNKSFVFNSLTADEPDSPQAVNNYTTARATGITYNSISGTGTSPTTFRNGLSTDDNLTDNLPIGFTFIYNGQAVQGFRMSTNGFLTFNTTSTATGAGGSPTAYGYENIAFSTSTACTCNALAPFYDDLQTAANANTLANLQASLKYQTTGTAGSRVLTAEWINFQDFNATSTANFNFQVKLYEADGHIEFVYGTMTQSAAAQSYTLGINAATISATPTAAELLTQQTANTATFSNTPSNALAIAPASNSMITFTPPQVAPAAPTGFVLNSVGSSSVSFSWTDNATNELGYVISSSSNGGTTFNLLGTLAANTTSITITGLAPSTAYIFRIQAVTEGVASAPLDGNATTNPPISGTKTIGPGGDFTTFNAAIAEANAGTGAGGVTFNVTAGTTFAENGTCITGGSAANPIVFQKSGAGANPIIQPPGSTSTQDSGICILGGDYITVNGIDVVAANNTVEYGYLVFNNGATNGATNNTILNSNITLDRTNTGSIGINQTLSTAATATSGANSNNRYYNITVQNASRGILLNGTSATVPDSNNEIGVTGGGTTTIGGAAANDIGGGTAASYGISTVSQSNVKIFNTEVRNVTVTGSVLSDGIFVSGFIGTNDIYNNRVHDIRNASTTATTGISGIRTTYNTTGTNVGRVYNNFVYNITSGYTGTASATRQIKGIFAAGTGGSTAQENNIDFNSVRIDGSVSPNISSTAFEIGTAGGALNRVRNNIFTNFTGAQTGVAKHYTYVSTSATALGGAGTVSNYNDLYVANTTNGFVGLGNATDFATLANFRTAFGQDANSISADPLFFGATDLHISQASPAINTGFTIGTITTDIDGQARPNGAAYDIGADEFYPSPGSVQLSSATYSVTEAIQTVTITVTRTGGASGAASVMYATAGGTATGGGSCGGSVDYVDTSGTINFADGDAAPKTFTIAVCADAVNEPNETVNITLTGATGAMLGTPNTAVLTIINSVVFNGTDVSVGAGQTYTSLTNAGGLFDAINNGSVIANTNILITSDLTTETGAIALNQFAGGFTVTIKPSSSPRAISGTSAGCLINLNGADRVTIDGSSTGGTSRDLTITNNSTGTTSAVVCMTSLGAGAGATFDTVKNTNIVGNASTTTFAGIFAGSATISATSLGADNSNNTIQNNNVSKAQYGIFTQGASATAKNTGNIILLNSLNTAAPNGLGKTGIYAGFENNIQITQNNIDGITSAVSSNDTIGISLGITGISTTTFTGNEVTNATVNRNYIGAVRHTNTYSACGICVAPATSGTNAIRNNMVAGVSANGTGGDFSVGVLLGGGTGSTTQFYFNSVSMTGTQTGGSEKSYALAIAGGDPIVDVRNNILSNTQNNGTGNNYAIGLGSTTFVNLTSDFNDFFVGTGATFFVGGTGSLSAPTNQATLANLRTATGKDTNSKNVDPLFTSLTDLHLLPASTLLGMGTPITGVTVDFDGDVRPAKPDIGADEIVQNGTLALSAATYTVAENGGTVTITVNRTGGFDGAAAVNYAFTDGSATGGATCGAGVDYLNTGGTVNFADGVATAQTFTVAICDDAVFEGNETFTVTLSGATGATLGTQASAVVTITENDTAPTISISNATVSEEGGNAVFTVTQSAMSAVNTTFTYSTADGTATAGTDYTGTAGTGTITAGSTTTTISIPIINDSIFEGNETFTVTLNTAGNATIATGTGTGTITDAADTPTISIASVSVSESGGNAVFTVTQSAMSAVNTTFSYTTADGTAANGSDYTGTQTGSGTIAAGSLTTTISIPINDDSIFEGNETFSVTLNTPVNATIATGTATGTITDAEDTPTISIGNATIGEGGGSAVFTVTQSAMSAVNTTFTYSTANGTATAGADYTGTTTGTGTITAGNATTTISIPITDDSIFEGDETFAVTLGTPVNATIATATGTGTITDNDTAPTISIDSVSVSEGGNAVFTVTQSAASAVTTTFTYSTANGTATAGTDYTGTTTGTGTIAAGSTTATISIPTTDDSIFEGNETFTVTLGAPVNATIATGTGTGTITDAADTPTISIASVSVSESGGNAVFTVTQSAMSAVTTTFTYSTADGTATAGADYTGATNVAGTITAGSTTTTISIPINDDSIFESNETFTVTLSNAVNATIATGTATGTITDNDTAPTFSISSVTQNEGNGGSTTSFTFTVTRTGASQVTASVVFATADGTATAGSDYTATTGTLNFAAGDTTKTITVLVNADTTTEPDETFTVNLSSPTGATIANGQGVGTILNDEIGSTGTIPAGTYTNLNTGTATLGGNVTVTGTLTLGGVLTTGGNTLTLGCAATVSGAGESSFVDGNVNKQFCTAPQTFTYPVGTTGTGTASDGYSPVDVTVTAVGPTNPSSLTIDAIDQTLFGLDNLASVSRSWSLTETGQITANLTFHYRDADEGVSDTDESMFDVFKRETTNTSIPVTGRDITANTISVTGISDFSIWGIGEAAGPTAATVDVGGRVMQQNGRGIFRARVAITDSDGNVRMAFTNTMGYYRFTDVPSGATYTFSAFHRRYQFAQPVQIRFIGETTESVNFAASGENGGLNPNARYFDNAPFDFDGDGRTDVSVYRASDNTWYITRSSDNTLFAQAFGATGDRLVPADYDGDGKTDLAMFRPSNGTWYIWQSTTNSIRSEAFGTESDRVIPADFDGDGKADLSVWNDFSRTWQVKSSADGSVSTERFAFGKGNMAPIASDRTGDGKADMIFFNQTTGVWRVRSSENGKIAEEQFGQAGDRAIVGDYDGDGIGDLAVYRAGQNAWYIRTGDGRQQTINGLDAANRTITGDFDGDGRYDVAGFDNGLWSIRQSVSQTVRQQQFGLTDDTIVPSGF